MTNADNSKNDCIYCDGTRMQIIQCIPGDDADFETIECKCCNPGTPTVEVLLPESSIGKVGSWVL